MKKQDLYKKYVQTFGIHQTFLDVIVGLGKLGISVSKDYISDGKPRSLPLQFSDEFHMGLAEVHIALEVIFGMMNEGDKQKHLTQKHYLLNQMERNIWNKEKEDETGSR